MSLPRAYGQVAVNVGDPKNRRSSFLGLHTRLKTNVKQLIQNHLWRKLNLPPALKERCMSTRSQGLRGDHADKREFLSRQTASAIFPPNGPPKRSIACVLHHNSAHELINRLIVASSHQCLRAGIGRVEVRSLGKARAKAERFGKVKPALRHVVERDPFSPEPRRKRPNDRCDQGRNGPADKSNATLPPDA